MSTRFAIFALLFSVSVGAAAEPPQLRTLDDKTISGELVAINGKSVILKVAGKNVETPLEQLLAIDIASAPKEPPAKDAKYTDVELTDGTLIHCEKFEIMGIDVQVTLLSGQEFKFPLDNVRWYRKEARDRAFQDDWERFLAKKTVFDQLVIKSRIMPGPVDVLDSIKCTVVVVGGKINVLGGALPPKAVSLERVHGIIFQRGPNPAAKPVICKIYDVNANVIIASAVTLDGDKLKVTTSDGVKFDLPRASLARLDYTPGKLAYLSDVKEKERFGADPFNRFRRDKNLDGGPIQLVGRPRFTKGLAIHAGTTLEYDLSGEFREFKAVVGVDELVGGADGITRVVIKGDGKELKTYEVSRKDNAPLDATLNIQKVKKLSIEVLSDGVLNLGHHADLAEARVSK